MPIKIENHFYPNLRTVVLMSTYPLDHLVQKQHLFLYFLFYSGLSLVMFSLFFLIFHYFFDVMIWMRVTSPFQWVDYIAGGRHDWLPWISWLKSTCSNHFQPPQWSSRTVTYESHAFRPFCQKIMKKYRNHQI